MKKRIILMLLLCAFILFVYLNRSYAHIYKTIDDSALQSPARENSYEWGARSQKPITYVAIGDSLTSGVGVDNFENSYAYRIAEMLSQKTDIDLRTLAFQGLRSGEAVVFANQAADLNPDIVTILIGVNDIHGNIPLEKFSENYELILKSLAEKTEAKVYVISIPSIGNSDLLLPPYGWYFDWQTRRFNAELRELADKYSAQYVDLYAGIQAESPGTDYYSQDLFHPSSAGYTLWSRIIYDHINF